MSRLSRFVVLSVVALRWEFPMVLASESGITSCSELGKQKELIIEKSGHAAHFNCPSNLTHLNPTYQASQAKVCTKVDCSTNAPLTSLVSGATLTETEASRSSTGKNYELMVQTLPVEDKTFYFLCQSAAARSTDSVPQDKCSVKIVVKAAPNAPVCKTGGETLDLQITAANSNISFVCGGSLSIKPDNSAKVYQGDNCSPEANLNDIVPGATLSSPGTNGLSSLSVTSLPAQQTKLCYKCQDSASNVCKVLVSVSPLTTTTTTDATTSGASQFTAQAALGALLAVAGLVYIV